MHAASPRAHHAQGRQEHLQILRISHYSREGHCPHLLRAEEHYRRDATASAPQRRPPSLRGPLQEVIHIVAGACCKFVPRFSCSSATTADIINSMAYNFLIETDREEDGRWIAEIPELPGVLAYGANREDAIRSVEALALRVLADKLEASKEKPLDPFAVTMASSIE